MSRPETAQDVVSLVRQAGLVGDPDCAGFLDRLESGVTADGAFARLVAEGLLTPYQADELSGGRWRGFWLGAYKVLDRLGKGGMGQVYLAEHAVLKKRAAVKVLSAGLRADPGARRRFVREARAAAALDHPNVVHVHDVDMDHDPPFLVMEYVDGVSLQLGVSRNGTLTGGEAAAVGAEVARGLAAAAAAGLVHRDIKPANLLVDRRGGVKILDLGIVRISGDETHPKLHEPDVILGTLDYLAPEQAQDSTGVDARADLYALGATLYFTLAGHPPFPGSDLRHKLAAKQYSDPPPIHRLRPDVDPLLSAVIQKLLCRDPNGRQASAEEAVEVLASFAALSPDFPARLFRGGRTSTTNDGPPEPPGSSLPATQRIVKPAPRTLPPSCAGPGPFAPRQSPPEAASVPQESGEPTMRVAKALTDLEMTALPQPPLRPGPPEPPPTPTPLPSSQAPSWWVLLAVSVVLATLATALLGR